MALVNLKKIIKNAYKGKYAVPHINTNNLKWSEAILTTAQEQKSPIIIAASEGAIKYMGGYDVVVSTVESLIKDLNITVPVALHLDHGKFDVAIKALKAGFPSVMYDGSALPFAENLEKSKEIIKLAKKSKASVEVEVGAIKGEEDFVKANNKSLSSNPFEVEAMSKIGADIIAIGINNYHGKYPPGWKGLDFDTLRKVSKFVKTPFVLHGGSGIPEDQIKKAISLGVAKINVNTELQIAFAKAIRKFVRSGLSDQGKNYDPRKFLNPGVEAMKEVIRHKMELFGSKNKAKV